MVRLIVQYLAIYNYENLRNRIQISIWKHFLTTLASAAESGIELSPPLY